MVKILIKFGMKYGRKLGWDTVRIFKKLGYDSIVIGDGAEIVVFDSKNTFIVDYKARNK